MHPRPHGRVEKIFAPYTETGTLATGELADHQPHVDDYIAQADPAGLFGHAVTYSVTL